MNPHLENMFLDVSIPVGAMKRDEFEVFCIGQSLNHNPTPYTKLKTKPYTKPKDKP
jgi:hypothetical protein